MNTLTETVRFATALRSLTENLHDFAHVLELANVRLSTGVASAPSQ